MISSDRRILWGKKNDLASKTHGKAEKGYIRIDHGQLHEGTLGQLKDRVAAQLVDGEAQAPRVRLVSRYTFEEDAKDSLLDAVARQPEQMQQGPGEEDGVDVRVAKMVGQLVEAVVLA